ncbi:hypothetical protein GGQ73_001602 [Rhizobium skierniewicense]|uniref:HTH lysR-type domain-containing protein n=1 Tax=Rhizobium skierniewicense TaxID=984260 RepID=A0A7W6G1D7_9HYPH|nr:hypothetical protein [Rhizobium skierniewicense]
MKINLDDPKIFVAVARAGGFREAARIASSSPSGMSDAVRRLEAELGVRLLECFLVEWKQFCWFKRDRLLVRRARGAALAYGQAVRAGRWPVSTNPEGRASFRQDKGDRLDRTLGYALRQSPLS